MTGFFLAVIMTAAGGDMIVNGGFDNGLADWGTNFAAPVRGEAAEIDGRTTGHICVPAEAEVAWPSLNQRLPAQPGMAYELTAEAMQRNISNGPGAYIAINFYDADGERISFGQSDFASMEDRWVRLAAFGVAPPNAETLRACLLLHGRGEAWFDSVALTAEEGMDATPVELDGPVTITVTGEVACDHFKGFGAEEDGWFFNEENARHGVDEADAALREKRIEYMSPDYVRMFCWYLDWNPSEDWETFTFDSPNMISRYKTLDIYQRLGATVNLTGVEWNMKDPYGQPEKVAKALGELFEHLIRVRGYTCVREWTLTNEPNTNWLRRGNSFEDFVKIHLLVRDEFDSRGLDVAIIGSDDTAGETWFAQCIGDPDYFEVADIFCSHRYFSYTDRGLATRFYNERLSQLREKTPVKPFVVGEFGFQDHRSGTVDNPIMEEYRYAIWTAAFTIEGLNAGVAGFVIWALHEVYYPGEIMMNYALWNFKDRGWSLRPVFHAWANFCRLTKAGDTVYRCVSSHPSNVSAAKVGDVLFWVNCGDDAADVALEGMKVSELRVWQEGPAGSVAQSGSDFGAPVASFTVPAMSFGYCR